MRGLSLGELTRIFLRTGNTTFGGGDPTIAAFHRELVERREALEPEQFGVVYALSRVTPGTNMLAFCAGAGWLLRGWAGSLAAVTSVTVPSAAIAVVLLATFDRLAKNPVSAAGLSAMIAAAVGLLFASAFGLLRSGLKGWNSARTLILAGAAFLLAWRRTLSPFEIILLIAAAGSLWPEEGEGKPE